MNWHIRYLDETDEDFQKLDGSQTRRVRKAIDKVRQNPLPRNEGGYGIALGNKGGVNLTGCCEIKLRGEGLRAIYKLTRTQLEMTVIIVGIREDEEVYDEANERVKKHKL